MLLQNEYIDRSHTSRIRVSKMGRETKPEGAMVFPPVVHQADKLHLVQAGARAPLGSTADIIW